MTPAITAAWTVYMYRNQRANAAYQGVTRFACRSRCGEDFPTPGLRRFHERGCGK